MIYGSTTPGTEHFDVAADTVVLGDPVVIDRPEFLTRIAAYMDGNGTADASQRIRAALYTEAGGLVAVGEQTTIADGQDARWVWLGFDGALHRVLPAGRYRPGIHTGAVGDGARMFTAGLPARGSLVVGPVTPAGSGRYWWFHVDGAGEVLEILLKTDGADGDTMTNAALFVQPTEPDHPGPYVWARPNEDGGPLVTVLADGDGDLHGDARLFIGGDRPPHTYPSLWLRTNDAGDGVVLDMIAEPPNVYPFEAGPPAYLPLAGTITVAPMLMETTNLIRIPTDVDDDYLSVLPFGVTQRVFGLGGVIRGSRVRATAGWYGRSFDPTDGAHAIVRTDGPLAELVGERVRVTRRAGGLRRSVAVYVHDEREFPDELDTEQILLGRRAFLELGNHALDNIETTVEVLS